MAAAEKAGVPLNVFHNRRWDADIQTLAAVLDSAELGELWSVESRMDQANAATLEVGPDAGLLRDLGSHLVDQMLWLLGPARTVYAELDHAELDHVEPAGGRTDTRFAAALRGDGDFPVPAAQAVHTLEVLDAARISAAENRVVDLPSP